jgi:hypothetical protein
MSRVRFTVAAFAVVLTFPALAQEPQVKPQRFFELEKEIGDILRDVLLSTVET